MNLIDSSSQTTLQHNPQHHQQIILWSLIALTILAWGIMVHQAQGMNAMSMMPVGVMPHPTAWTLWDFGSSFLMWAVMMAAMMIPSAIPMVLVFFSVNRTRQRDLFTPTWIFVSGYLVVWIGFSFLATAAQWFLNKQALLCPMMMSTSVIFSGVLLILAGVFQFTPLKNACLKHCRTPFDFIMTEWREGRLGAFVMGLRHGVYCTGCCWALMALLFVVGVMNLIWIAVISVFVLLEKILPKKIRLSYWTGALLIVWGLGIMATHL